MKGQPARRENGARAILSIWRAVCILALAGTLWFIFSHSAQPAPVSGAQSRGVMAFVNEVLGSWGLPGVSEHLCARPPILPSLWPWAGGPFCAPGRFPGGPRAGCPGCGAQGPCARLQMRVFSFLRQGGLHGFPIFCWTAAACWRALAWSWPQHGPGGAGRRAESERLPRQQKARRFAPAENRRCFFMPHGKFCAKNSLCPCRHHLAGA